MLCYDAAFDNVNDEESMKFYNERITNHAHAAASSGAVMMMEMKIVMMI
jgi:hypothetical protein